MPFVLRGKLKEIPIIPEKLCIGKFDKNTNSGMLTITHCRIVAYVMKAMRKCLSPYLRHKLPKKVYVLGALHDIGKISPSFLLSIYRDMMQSVSHKLYNRRDEFCDEKKKFIRHEPISEAWFNNRYAYKGKIAKLYGSILGMHHGRRGVISLPETHHKYGDDRWAQLRSKVFVPLIEEFGDPCFSPIDECEAELMAGFLSTCDWIGSQDKYFPSSGKIKENEIKSMVRKAIKDLGWEHAVPRKGKSFFDLFGFEPRPVQKEFIKIITKHGVYIIEDSTGMGKTEAGLMGAYNLICKGLNNGIYFALPTRVTSERLFGRVKSFLEKAFSNGNRLCLTHGQSFISELNDEESSLPSRKKWFMSNRRALMLPFCIGTIDQILKAVVHSKFNFVRMFGLANKVIIIDELHSYGAYTGEITNALIEKLLKIGCSIIILSATLTRERKEQILGKY